MIAGLGKACITPPIGTRMSGFGNRDRVRGCEAVHDDLFVRALYVEHDGETVLIAGFDLLFFSRENAERLKAAVGRVLDLAPRRILLNTSHTHVGSCVDTWGFNGYVMPDRVYMDEVERGLVTAAAEARASAREAVLSAGATRTRLPVSRRRPDGGGGVGWGPYLEGEVCNHLPLALFRDTQGAPICLLYSVSCHPSTIGGWTISADYPGAASELIDRKLGSECSLFLQGAGGDAKACVIADGRNADGPHWRSGNWEDVAEAGRIVADDVLGALDGLAAVAPEVASRLDEIAWPLQAAPDRTTLREALEGEDELRRLWAENQLGQLDRARTLPTVARSLVQLVSLGEGLRIVAVEGELVGEMGEAVLGLYTSGVTFALGYSNGTGIYLPNSRMIREGGYETESYYEYGCPAPLAEGTEKVLVQAVTGLRDRDPCRETRQA